MATYRRLFPDTPSDFGREWRWTKRGRSVLDQGKKWEGQRQTRYGAWRSGSNVQLVGIEAMQDKLRFMLENTEDLRPAWKGLYHPYTTRAISTFFASSGDNRWPDLTDKYLFYKARHGGGTRTLIGTPIRKSYPRVTGTLYNSLTNPTHAQHIYQMSPRWMRMGTRDPLANIHFSKVGHRRRRKPIDARSPSMQAAFRRAVEEHANWYDQTWGSDGI